MSVTCGIYLYSLADDKFLICHATHARWNQWSIPKGLKDDGEEPFAAAARELNEETGVDLNKLTILAIHQLPQVKYEKRDKTLAPFLVITDSSLSEFHFHCTHLTVGGFPEIDKWKLVDADSMKNWVHESQLKNMDMINDLIKSLQIDKKAKP